MDDNNQHDDEIDQHDDEIDLRELVWMLIEGWYWIIGTVAAALGLALMYVLVTPLSYSTDLTLVNAQDGLTAMDDVPSINYTPADVRVELAQRLGSFRVFRSFLEDSDKWKTRLINSFEKPPKETGEVEEALSQFFFDNISVERIDNDGEGERIRESVSIAYTEGLEGHALLNAYFNWAESEYQQLLVRRSEKAIKGRIRRNTSRMQAHLDNEEQEIANRVERLSEDDQVQLENLKDKLEAEKQAHRDSVLQRIKRLEEAENMAELIGIEKPSSPYELGSQSGEQRIVYADINAQGSLPLYFMGTEALKAEREVLQANLDDEAKTSTIRDLEKRIAQLRNNRQIEALRAREDQKPFVDKYNELRAANTLLSSITVNKDDLEVARVVNTANQPVRPDGPRKRLILVLAVMLGGMLGVFLAFGARFVRSLRGYHATH